MQGVSQPWKVKDAARKQTITALAVNLVCLLGSIMEPYMPGAASSIFRQLNIAPQSIPDALTLVLRDGHVLNAPELLFTTIDQDYLSQCRARFAGAPPPTDTPAQ